HLRHDVVGELVGGVVPRGDRGDHLVGEVADGVGEVLVLLVELEVHGVRSWSVGRGSVCGWVPGRTSGTTRARSWCSRTCSPARTESSTVPAVGAVRRCSIFMASTTTTVWPSATRSPVAAGTATTVPGMGECSSGAAG